MRGPQDPIEEHEDREGEAPITAPGFQTLAVWKSRCGCSIALEDLKNFTRNTSGGLTQAPGPGNQSGFTRLESGSRIKYPCRKRDSGGEQGGHDRVQGSPLLAVTMTIYKTSSIGSFGAPPDLHDPSHARANASIS